MTTLFQRDFDKVPEPTLRRLPWYLSTIKLLREKGEHYVSSTQISKDINVDASQIAKDLSYVKVSGRTRVGYEIDGLIAALEAFLGFTDMHRAFLFGAGSLGRALLGDSGLHQFGLEIVAAFDVNPDLVDTKLGGVPVYHIDGLDTFVREHRVSVAVLTVPGAVAVDTARRLSKLGVDGIWNFTNVELPEQEMPEVKVENVHFADSLLTLSYMISEEEV